MWLFIFGIRRSCPWSTKIWYSMWSPRFSTEGINFYKCLLDQLRIYRASFLRKRWESWCTSLGHPFRSEPLRGNTKGSEMPRPGRITEIVCMLVWSPPTESHSKSIDASVSSSPSEPTTLISMFRTILCSRLPENGCRQTMLIHWRVGSKSTVYNNYCYWYHVSSALIKSSKQGQLTERNRQISTVVCTSFSQISCANSPGAFANSISHFSSRASMFELFLGVFETTYFLLSQFPPPCDSTAFMFRIYLTLTTSAFPVFLVTGPLSLRKARQLWLLVTLWTG